MKYYWKALFLSTGIMLFVTIGYRFLFLANDEPFLSEVMALPADQGEEVAEIQRRLAALGYYHGEVSGNYDFMTSEAVRRFQQEKGIDVSGNCNPETLYLLGMTVSGEELADYEQRRFVASTVDAVCPEAPYLVRVALAGVLFERMGRDGFPNDVTSIVFADHQFCAAFTHDYSREPSALSWRAATDAELGMSPCPGALYYYNTTQNDGNYVGYRIVYKNGMHVFLSDELTSVVEKMS